MGRAPHREKETHGGAPDEATEPAGPGGDPADLADLAGDPPAVDTNSATGGAAAVG